MLRNATIGALVFGLSAAIAGWVWTAFEFPFVILVPAFLGWHAVVRPEFGNRKAFKVAAVGGVTFTAVFLVGMSLAMGDGSPITVTGWLVAVIAAVVAGALTGAMLDGVRGALPVASLSAAGMSAATVVVGLLRDLTPAAAQVPGAQQYAYFALGQGISGLLVGAAVGIGVVWVRRHVVEPRPSGRTRHRVHPA